jgi:hypothetical protein
MRVLAIAIAGLTLLSVSPTQATPNQARSIDTTAVSAAAITDFSAAKRHKKQVRKQARINRDEQFLAIRSQTHQAERAQIACPRSGCQPIPRGCLREPERTLGGEPTGFDRIACPMR